MRKLAQLLIFLFALLFSCAAQEKRSFNVSGDFLQVPLTDFLAQTEKQLNIVFYYEKSQIDSVLVTGTFNNEPLQQVLTKIFKDTDLQFAIDNQGRVFISKGIKLVTTLAPGFFPGKDQSPVADTKNKIVEFGLQNQKQKAVSVNKLYEIGKGSPSKGNATITGIVRNAKTGEVLANASVFVSSTYATMTDAYGYYSLSVPLGKYSLNILAIGMQDTQLQLIVYGDGRMDADIPERVTTLKEVVVSARKTNNVMQTQMGIDRISIANIKRIPSLFGEADLLRAVTTLPGVKTVGEASTGFNVRGGSADQNLILFNGSTIYNPSHFFGMFSAFNPEVVKDIELYKSSVPAKFGGRLSSVLDITSREGNKKKVTGSAGIGAITSRVQVEGPIGSKTSFIFGGRTTYANWLLTLLPDEYKNSKASFQDINIGISHSLDSSNQIYFNGYYSNDRFSLNSDTVYGYSNRNINIKWKKSFNTRMSAVFMAGADEYQYSVLSDENPVNAFALRFKIRQFYARADFSYYKNQYHSFEFGVSSLLYKLNPGSFTPRGDSSSVIVDKIAAEQALENGVYVTHKFNPTNKLSFNTGLRFSLYHYLGAQNVNYYAAGLPITPANLVETKTYKSGNFIKTYGGPEVRFSVRYAMTNDFSIKASYNSLRQYIHMMSNTTAIAPTDVWKLSDPNIKPQIGDQVSFGVYKNLKSNTIETSLEVYYKRIKNYLDYKPGATLIMNHDIETEVIKTTGKAYGVELLIKKPAGKLNGWISYTYSRILLKTAGSDPSTPVNKGKYYPANYDKPHDITFMGTFRVNHRFSVSLNSTYSTGRPITLPIGRYFYAGSYRVLYSDRNAYRIPDYFRTDLSMNIEGNHKEKQKTHNSWTIGFYNMLGRRNPFSVYFISENGHVNGYQLSIFGSVIPFINYNIRF
ncbi:MAG TPA: carboxypeptidase regulatory-like domain-containing protein [Chitinophagaceae bacterium]